MAAGVIFLITVLFLGISIVGVGLALMAIELAKRVEWDHEK